MTGFGVGRASLGKGRVVVEVRSVNHRFLDVRVRLPRELADATMHLEHVARQRLKRGRFEFVVRTDGLVVESSTLDMARAEAVYRSLCELRDRVVPGADVPFSMLSSVPDIFVGESERHWEALLESLEQAFGGAIDAMETMREIEGAALYRDLSSRLDCLRRHLASISGRRAEIVEAYRRRLRERVARLVSGLDTAIDVNRLEQEIAIAADRSDIEEELTRLSSHFEQFDKLGDVQEPVGRRLDFLLQEMSREVNTIGAKSQDAPVAHAVVEIKAEIERMREQVQNVE
jgi:uncharacterized protein (TIGR00255 family)